MRTVAILALMLAWALSAAATPAETAAPTLDEKDIRGAADVFTKAYNAHDAKALAGLFTADGEIINEAGERLQGREAIEQTFAAAFGQRPQAQISVAIESLRFVAPTVAIEEGATTVQGMPDEPAEHHRYTVVHVKQDGRWQMASARDVPDEAASARQRIDQLGWLVGRWVHETPEALVITDYRWNEAHDAIVSDFRIQVGGRPAMIGTQRIGWDPSTKAIRSWVFDSDGDVAQGGWTRDGNHWIIKTTGATHEGRVVSSTQVISPVAKDRMTWQSRDRVVGDEVLPNIEEIVMVRTPPQPAFPAQDAKHDSTGALK